MLTLNIDMEMPDRCTDCIFLRKVRGSYCGAALHRDNSVSMQNEYAEKPLWCPLRKADKPKENRNA